MPEINFSKLLRRTLKLFASPWMILVAVLIGAYLGIFHVDLAKSTKLIGDLYLSLFKMCVFPILTSGIIMSLGRLMQRHDSSSYVKRMLVVFPVTLLGLSLLSIILGLSFAPGKNLDTHALNALGVLVNKSGIDVELALSGPLPAVKESSVLTEFLMNLVPGNIFQSLTEGNTLQVLFFSMVFGVALGFVPRNDSHIFFTYLDAVYKSFLRVIAWLSYLLPIGLCSLIAAQIARVGIETLIPMLKFIGAGICIFLLVYTINTIIIWVRTRLTIQELIQSLREPTILALATSNSLACLPSSITSMEKSMKFDEQSVNLLLPLSITICRYGAVVYFGLGAVFVAQLYGHTLATKDIIVMIIGVVLAAMATSGVTGILTLTMLGIVLDPLGLPLDAVLVLFIAIDPIMDPFRTLTNVHMGMMATSLIAPFAVDEIPDIILDLDDLEEQIDFIEEM